MAALAFQHDSVCISANKIYYYIFILGKWFLIMKRINIIGTSGSGKSTISKRLAEILDVPYIELDALFWQPDWPGVSDDELFETLEKRLTETDGWVLDGNYSRTTPIKCCWVT